MTPQKTNWVNQVFPYYEILRIFTFYLDLEFWIVSLEDTDRWHEVRRHQRLAWPVDFDYFYGKREERPRYNEVQIRRVVEKGESFSSAYQGLSTFFVPVRQNGKTDGVLLSGVFLREIPGRESILEQWKELTGNDVTEFNPEFLKWVRTQLECPLVEGPVYRALKEILELYAGVLGGETDPDDACRRTEELKLNVLAKNLSQKFWLDVLVKTNRFYPPTWRVGRMTEWEKAELGIDRAPDTVLALRVDDLHARVGDDLDLILRNRHFQREMFKFSRTLPNTVCSPLEDYGVLFFLSPKPGLNEVQTKLEILDKIDVISKFADDKLKVKLLAGASRCFGPRDDISRVFREAVTALGFCLPLNRPVLFYEDVRTNPTIPLPDHFYRLSKRLIEVYSRGMTGETENVRNEYIGQILSQSAGRPEIMRLHFLYACGEIVEALRKKAFVPGEHLSLAFSNFEKQLQRAGAIADLLLLFREFLKRLLDLTLRPVPTSQSLRMDGVRRYIEENFNQDLRLEQVAKENGFSTSVFAKVFKKNAGMGFSAYLRKARLEHSKKLLVSTELSITQISQECGFNNLQYFFDLFKRATGKTPQEFRKVIAAST